MGATPGASSGTCPLAPFEVPPGTSGTYACSGNTCGASNTYDPGPAGCVRAAGARIATPGRDAIHAVILPPQTAMDVVAIPTSNWDVALYVTTSDDPALTTSSCIDGIDAAFNGGEEVLVGIGNAGATADTFFVIVDSPSTSGTFGCGPYELEVRYRPDSAVGGEDCGDPIDVDLTAGDVTVEITTCGAANDIDLATSKCAASVSDTLSGRDVVLRLAVPDSVEWSLVATPLSPWDVALVVDDACDGFVGPCLAASDAFRVGEAERVGPVRVPPGPDRQHYVLLDSSLPVGSNEGCGRVRLAFRVAPLPPTGGGAGCGDPIAVTLPGNAIALDGFSCDHPDAFAVDPLACGGVARGQSLPGRDVVYAVRVDAPSFSILATPEGPWDVALVVRGPCASGCIAASDRWGAGRSESVVDIANPSPGTTYHVIVDSAVPPGGAGGCGRYTLEILPGGATPIRRASWGEIKARYREGE